MFFIAVLATSTWSWKVDAFLVTSETRTVISPKMVALYIVKPSKMLNIAMISMFVRGPISFPPKAMTAV